MSESSYSNAKQLLKEENALNVKATRENILKDRTLLRYWPEIPFNKVQECLDFLGKFASVKNTKESHSVTNPKVNKEEVPGEFHHVQEYAQPRRPGSEPDVQDVFQQLQLGWITTGDLLPTPVLLTDDKALLSPFAHDTDSVKNAYVWEYRWIDPGYAQTLRDTILLEEGVVDAKIVNADDGSCKIQVLTQTNTWAGTLSQTWEKETQNPSFAAEKRVETFSHIPLASLDGFKTTLGTATSGYKVSSLIDSTAEEGFAKIVQTQDKLFDGTVSASNGTLNEDEYLQLITGGVIRTTTWLGVKDADLVAAMATVAVAPSGYTVLKVGNNYNGTGSFTLTRVMMLKGSSTSMKIKVDFPSFEDERRTYFYPGLDKTTANALLTTAQTTCDTGYKIDSVEIQEWRYGALAVIQQISKIMLTPAEGLGCTISKEFEPWGDADIISKKWLNIKDANLDAALTTLSIAPTGYSVATISHNFDGTGSADITRVVVKKNITGFESAIEFPTFDDERKTNIYLGLDSITAGAQYTILQTAPAGYKIDSVTKQRGLAGTITIIQQISKLNLTLTGRVQSYDYTKAFGLVKIATTIYPNIAKASINGLKTTILTDATKIVLDIRDDDTGQGKANVFCTWRSKEAAPRSLGAIRATKASQFHKTEEDRLWIDVNLTDKDALATAVAQALAGTAPYGLAATEEVREVTGEDAGDKTARVRQHVVKAGTPTAANYSMQESFNPHGLQEAVMVISVREYPEVDYTNVGTIFALLQTFLGTPAKGRIQVSMNGNGTFSMRALKEGTPDWDNITPTYVKVGIQNKGLIGESKTDLATGVPVADAAAIVSAATADADHALVGVEMTERGQGEAAIEKKQIKKSETAVQVEETPGLGLRRATKDYTWPLILSANVAAVWAAAETQGVAGNYVLHFRQKNILGNGLFSITSQVVECTEKKTSYTNAYTDDSIVTVEECQDAAEIPVIADTVGTEESVKGSLNLFNKYDYIKTTVTSRVPKSCAAGATWNVRGSYYTVEGYSFEIVTTPPEKSYNWHSSTNTWQVQEIHTISYYKTAVEAAAFVHTFNNGSGIHPVGGNLWMAHKVERSDLYIGQQTYSKPTQ
jgi:hypothetical protein